jgi:hypothetical protein
VRRILAGSAIVVGLVLTAATPAQAAMPGQAGRLSIWENDNYEGCGTSRVDHDSNMHYDDNCGENGIGRYDLNDRLSSFVNRTGSWWILYEDKNYNGKKICVRPNSHDNNIGNDTGYEDDISSFEKIGTSKPIGCDDVTGTAN